MMAEGAGEEMAQQCSAECIVRATAAVPRSRPARTLPGRDSLTPNGAGAGSVANCFSLLIWLERFWCSRSDELRKGWQDIVTLFETRPVTAYLVVMIVAFCGWITASVAYWLARDAIRALIR